MIAPKRPVDSRKNMSSEPSRSTLQLAEDLWNEARPAIPPLAAVVKTIAETFRLQVFGVFHVGSRCLAFAKQAANYIGCGEAPYTVSERFRITGRSVARINAGWYLRCDLVHTVSESVSLLFSSVNRPDKRRAYTLAERVAEFGRALAVEIAFQTLLQEERSSREQTDRMDLALRNAGLGYWDWDLRTDKVLYSISAVEPGNKGLALQTMMGRDQEKIIHPDDKGSVEQRMGEVLAGRSDVYQNIVRQISSDRSDYIYVDSRGRVAEKNGDGRPLRIVGVYWDATDRIARERQNRIRDERLALALRLASAAEITASIAHEINQPLAAVLGLSDAAKRFLEQVPPKVTEAAQAMARCEEAAQRASQIVKSIRSLVSRETSEQTLSIASVIRESVDALRQFAEQSNVFIDCRAIRGPLMLRGNVVQLEQVVRNLLRNAIQAVESPADQQARHIVVRASADGNRVVVAVTNPLVMPLPEGTLERLTEPFFTTKPGNMGLGLSICKSILEAHGGSLEIRTDRRTKFSARASLPGIRKCT